MTSQVISASTGNEKSARQTAEDFRLCVWAKEKSSGFEIWGKEQFVLSRRSTRRTQSVMQIQLKCSYFTWCKRGVVSLAYKQTQQTRALLGIRYLLFVSPPRTQHVFLWPEIFFFYGVECIFGSTASVFLIRLLRPSHKPWNSRRSLWHEARVSRTNPFCFRARKCLLTPRWRHHLLRLQKFHHMFCSVCLKLNKKKLKMIHNKRNTTHVQWHFKKKTISRQSQGDDGKFYWLNYWPMNLSLFEF